jgi:hypothetical protein
MFGTTYSNGILRKYVILFGTVFNNIYITREDSNGESVQTLKVPLSYGPKEKYLARLEGNPDGYSPIAMTVPRISFEMTTFEYDPDRKLNTLNRKVKNNKYQYQPVPYNIQFQLSVLVKNAEDGTKIVEQILPYFTPEWTASIHLIPSMEDDPWDIPIILNNISCEDTYEGNFQNRRAIIWTLNFTMKGYVFGPSKRIGSGDGTDGGIIKYIDVNIRPTSNVSTANTTNTIATETVHVYPGLTANGEPTSNSAASIDWSLINADDNYGFIHEFESNV